MKLDGETRLADLLETYPFLVDVLADYAPGFEKLRNPFARKAMAGVATLSLIASMADGDLDRLLRVVEQAIRERTDELTMIHQSGGLETAGNGLPAAEKQQKTAILKGLIKDLHAGVDFAAVKRQFTEQFSDLSGAEIAAMEQQLVAEGMPESEITKLCDVHVAVFRDVLSSTARPETIPGHPIHTFRLENEAIDKVVQATRVLLGELGDPPAAGALEGQRVALTGALALLSQVHRHYLRKENQLFPFLEKHGITAPPKVMWAIHDEIRSTLKRVQRALDAGDASTVASDGDKVLTAVADMIYKEEHILFPLCLETLTEADWAELHEGEDEVGYAIVERGDEWHARLQAPAGQETEPLVPAGPLPMRTGLLTLEQINLLLTNMPFDVTFVDENDRVRYYSAGRERIFPRSPGIIGRAVQNCHPPASVDIVQRILDEFKAGTKDEAEFWITMDGKFLHIRYLALRDTAGEYRGVLEVVQDATGVRALAGERRLLDW